MSHSQLSFDFGAEPAKALVDVVNANALTGAPPNMPRGLPDDGHVAVINAALARFNFPLINQCDNAKIYGEQNMNIKNMNLNVTESATEAFLEADVSAQAANDNPAPSHGRVAAYGSEGKVSVHLTLNEACLSELGLSASDKVRIAWMYAEIDGDWRECWLLLSDAEGQSIAKRPTGNYLIQARGVVKSAFPAVPVVVREVEINRRKVKVLCKAPRAAADTLPKSFLTAFETIDCGPAGRARLKLLAANDNHAPKPTTTAAGDECYTPRFLIDALLRAGERKTFDADFCSMRSDGRYDKALPADVISERSDWRGPNGKLRVIGHVPAEVHYTHGDGRYGSLLKKWKVESGWINPPYTNRCWAVFLEKAAKEVAADRAGILTALVPKDDTGEHIGQLFSENAYRIELCRQIPFFKVAVTKKSKAKAKDDKPQVLQHVVETIRGNQLVVFGKGAKTRRYLERLVDELRGLGLITAQQVKRYKEEYAVAPRLRDEEPVSAPPVATTPCQVAPAEAPMTPPPAVTAPCQMAFAAAPTISSGSSPVAKPATPPKAKKRTKSKTGIAWATATVNPFKGCSKVSAECKNCYAVNWAARHQAKGTLGYDGTVKDRKFTGRIGVAQHEFENLRKATSERVFVNSMSDTFHESVSEKNIKKVFKAMADNTSDANFLVCTKRSARMAAFSANHAIPDKVWCGVTVGCRKSLARLDDLRRVKAKIRWASIEPLLEEIDIEPWLADGTLQWVVVGGESGPGHRPMDPAWAEKIQRACVEHGVPFFLKQWSAMFPKKDVEYPPMIDGREWREYPTV